MMKRFVHSLLPRKPQRDLPPALERDVGLDMEWSRVDQRPLGPLLP